MKYLIPFDFSTVSENAVVQALKLANKTSGNLLLVHFVDDNDEKGASELKFKNYINTLKTEIPVAFQVIVGDVFNDVGKVSDAVEADYVVMGTHGVNLTQRMFGSNAVKIISNSDIPFLVFQEGAEFDGIKKIIIPISIESKSIQVVRYAAALSKLYDAEIHLVGRLHTDEFYKRRENVNVILINNLLVDEGIKHHFEIVEVDKSDFEEYLLDYAAKNEASLIAVTYYSDAILPVFEKFVQHLIVNEKRIPVMSVNAQSLSKASSTLSFMTT